LLIIEDDASSRSALAFVLARRGWDVATVGTLAEGMDRLRGSRVDCVVLDLMLPDGDGVAILKHLRQTAPTTRIAVTTGVLDAAWLDHVRAAKPDCLLIKPIKLSDLLACLG